MKQRQLLWVACLVGVVFGVSTPTVFAGDVDGDGVEDSIDVCNNTPFGVDVDAVGRPLGDVDFDCDSDLEDYSLMQDGFTGPLTAGCLSDLDCEDGDACTVNVCNATQGQCTDFDVPNCANCVVPVECGTELTCGQHVEAEINPSIETDKYCFCVTENENLRIHVAKAVSAPTAFTANWRVLDAGSNAVGPCGAFAITAGRDCGPLPAAGNPYRLEIEDQNRDSTGAYSVQLNLYDPSEPCGAATVAACESLLTGGIEHVNDSDLVRFEAGNGEMARITVVKDALAPANFGSNWRLLDGTGGPVPPCDTFAITTSRDCGPLTSALNPYRIEVEDQGRNEIGTYRVHLQRLTSSVACGVADVACDNIASGTIEPFLDTDLLNFAGGGNEIVRITVIKKNPAGPNFSVNWRLLGNDGIGFGTCGTFTTTGGRDCGPLSSLKSPYRIEVEDQGRNDTGAYDVHLQRLTQFHECDVVDLSCQVVANGATSSPLDTDLFRFSAPEDEMVRISLLEQPGSGTDYAPNWRLLNAAGVPTSNCSAFAISVSRDCGPLPASGNPYRVEVEDQGRNDVGFYQIIANFLSGCPTD